MWIPDLELVGGNNFGRIETGELRADFECCSNVPSGKLFKDS